MEPVPSNIEVRHGPLSRQEIEAAGELSWRAFGEDDLFAFIFPVERRRPEAIASLHRGVLIALKGRAEFSVALQDDALVALAVWVPPGGWPFSFGTQLRQARTGLVTMAKARANPLRGSSLMAAVAKAHLRVPHWYLQLVMVDPSHQRRGLGSRLIEPVLEICDREGLPAALETQKTENLAYYARFGFREMHRSDASPDGPSIWSLERTPKA